MTRTRWITMLSGLLLALLLLAGIPEAAGPYPASASQAAAKKTCKWVTKKVNGKKQRVKVCTTVKPKATPTPSPTATPSPTPTPTLVSPPTSPDPLTVTLHADAGSQASQTIGTTGGSLSTTANGMSVTLTIPKGALTSDTRITLTPITSITNLPFSGGLTVAVQLQPEGLQLLKAAALDVSLPAAIPVSRQLSFAATGEGKDFHLYPQGFDPNHLSLQLTHFSGYGLGQGTMADVVAISRHPPSSWQGQVEQLGAMIAKERQAQLLGLPSPFKEGELTRQMEQAARSQYEQLVLPQMQQAATSDSEAFVQQAIGDAIAWMRTVQLLGLDFEAEQAKLSDLLGQALTHQLELAQQRCGTGTRTLAYDPILGWVVDPAGVGKIIGLLRNGQLLGLGGPFDATVDASLRTCRPHGFKFQMTWSFSDWLYDFMGQVCGDTPFGKPWKIAGRELAGYTTQKAGNWDVTFSAPGEKVTVAAYSIWFITVSNGAAPQMHAQYPPYVDTSVEITEDPTCPAVP